MTQDELRTLAAEGVGVGSHGMDHEYLTRVSTAALAEVLASSRAALSAIAGHPVDAIAYPWGRVDERVASAARMAGYRVGFALNDVGCVPPSLAAMAIPRTCIYSPDQILGLFASTGPWAPRPFRALRGAFARTGLALVTTALAARRLGGVRP
jgi:peptidoglycan/xylan/chitin deacetylase (PgdA/CDA1 family)